MKKERVFSRAVLLSAVFALSQFAGSANAQELKLAPSGGLKSVPIRSLFGLRKPVEQVQFQDDKTDKSTVSAELQKLQEAKAKKAQEERSSTDRDRRLAARRAWRAQKPAGLLQRLFGGDEAKAKEPQPATQKPAPVPRPPALHYKTADGSLTTSGVPARLASQSKVVSSPKGVAKAEGHSNRFVSPFEAEQTAPKQDVLLDLDSLIAREKAVANEESEIPVKLASAGKDQLAVVTPDEEGAAVLAPVEINNAEPEKAEAVIPQAQDPIEIEEAVVKTTPDPIVIEKEEPVTAEVPLLPPTDINPPAAVEAEPVDVTKTETPIADTTPAPKQEKQLTPAQKRAKQRQQILERSGQKGFKGFCPVQLRNKRELIDSSDRFAARYGLNTYYLSSAEAKAEFEADPARFAPAAGGADVVVLTNTEEPVEGSLDFCLWYRDRLYLFSSRETQQIFSRSPARFVR